MVAATFKSSLHTETVLEVRREGKNKITTDVLLWAAQNVIFKS